MLGSAVFAAATLTIASTMSLSDGPPLAMTPSPTVVWGGFPFPFLRFYGFQLSPSTIYVDSLGAALDFVTWFVLSIFAITLAGPFKQTILKGNTSLKSESLDYLSVLFASWGLGAMLSNLVATASHAWEVEWAGGVVPTVLMMVFGAYLAKYRRIKLGTIATVMLPVTLLVFAVIMFFTSLFFASQRSGF